MSGQTTGQKLRAWRREAGWSGVEMARRLGVSWATLHRWELGLAAPDAAHRLDVERVTGGAFGFRVWEPPASGPAEPPAGR